MVKPLTSKPILRTLKTTINEVLSPWNLLFSYFLEDGQILKHSHYLVQSLIRWENYEMQFPAHLYRLYAWSNKVTYHPNFGTCFWIRRKKTGSRSSLINVLNHCKLYEEFKFKEALNCYISEKGFYCLDLLTDRGWCHQFPLQELAAWGLIFCIALRARAQRKLVSS